MNHAVRLIEADDASCRKVELGGTVAWRKLIVQESLYTD